MLWHSSLFLGAQISLTRLEEFFLLPEVDQPLDIEKPPADDPNLCLSVTGASFIWPGMEILSVKSISLRLRRGQITAVVGDMSCAKTLLASLMGQIRRTEGEISMFGYAEFFSKDNLK